MNTIKLKVGACYCLKGGHVMRYHGPTATAGVHAFGSVSAPLSSPPTGHLASFDDVIFEFTVQQIPWLERRIKDSEARSLWDEARNAQLVLDELTGYAR